MLQTTKNWLNASANLNALYSAFADDAVKEITKQAIRKRRKARCNNNFIGLTPDLNCHRKYHYDTINL